MKLFETAFICESCDHGHDFIAMRKVAAMSGLFAPA